MIMVVGIMVVVPGVVGGYPCVGRLTVPGEMMRLSWL